MKPQEKRIERVGGYITLEENIVGLTTREIEATIGFTPGLLSAGARILRLLSEPKPGQFVAVGSTRYPNGKGLIAQEALRKATFMPGAWLRRSLIKVVPLVDSGRDSSPPASGGAVEQWRLLTEVPAVEVCRLPPGKKYFR